MEEVVIRNVNETYVQISCSEGVAYELRDAFTFKVPGYQFTPQFKVKLWDGSIRLFNIMNHQLYRGLTQHVEAFCHERGYHYTYDDEQFDTSFSLIEAKNFIANIKPKHEPRDYQLDAFVHAIRQRRALLLSPTASGKSLIIYLIMRYLLEKEGCKKLLIIVPTISLVEQLYTDFADYSSTDINWITEENVHQIYAGHNKDTPKNVVISTWQSLQTLPPKYFLQYDSVIGDEAHLFKAKSLTKIMCALTLAKYRIGSTGTLDGTKTHKLVLEGLFGPVQRVTTTKQLMDQKKLANINIKCLLLKHSDSICKAAKTFTYQQEIEYIVANEARNRFIRNLALSLEGNTLVLYQFVEKHGKILFELINEKDRDVYFVYGKIDADNREEIRKIVDGSRNAIIVASYGTFSTGINIRNLHNVVFASPSKSRIRNLQSIGRSLRISDTKTEATLYDIADDLRYKKHDNFTLSHFLERIKLYGEESFTFKIYKIDLKDN